MPFKRNKYLHHHDNLYSPGDSCKEGMFYDSYIGACASVPPGYYRDANSGSGFTSEAVYYACPDRSNPEHPTSAIYPHRSMDTVQTPSVESLPQSLIPAQELKTLHEQCETVLRTDQPFKERLINETTQIITSNTPSRHVAVEMHHRKIPKDSSNWTFHASATRRSPTPQPTR